jgi:hypothetical protein
VNDGISECLILKRRPNKANNFLYLYMETLIAHPANKEQLNAIKTSRTKCNSQFIAKIRLSQNEIKAGKGVRMKVNDLWNK